MVNQIISLFFWLGIVPLYTGALLIKKNKSDQNSLFLTYLAGIICMFATFQIFSIPMIFMNMSLDSLMYIWCGTLVLLTIISIFENKTLKRIRKDTRNTFKIFERSTLFVFLCICIQIFIFAYTQHLEGDDSFYLGTATTAWGTNTMYKFDPYTGDPLASFPARYVLAPFPILIAILGNLLQMHPVIVAHTVLPFILIPMSYMTLYLIARHLFPNRTKAVSLFMFFVVILHSFGYFSVYSTSTFLLLRIWQGKAVIANILLPFSFLFMIKIMKEEGSKSEWILLFLTTLASCMVSSMGVILIPFFIGCFGVSYAIVKKKIRILLYTIISLAPCIIYGGIYYFIK